MNVETFHMIPETITNNISIEIDDITLKEDRRRIQVYYQRFLGKYKVVFYFLILKVQVLHYPELRNKENDYVIHVLNHIGQEQEIMLSGNKLTPTSVCNEFRRQHDLSFTPDISNQQLGAILCAYISHCSTNDIINVSYYSGWQPWEPARYLYFRPGSNDLLKKYNSTFPLMNHSLLADYNSKSRYVVQDFLNTFTLFENEEDRVIILLWHVYSLLFSWFKNQNITLNTTLVFCGDSSLSVECALFYLQAFNRDKLKSRSLYQKKAQLHSLLSASRDETIIFSYPKLAGKYQNDVMTANTYSILSASQLQSEVPDMVDITEECSPGQLKAVPVFISNTIIGSFPEFSFLPIYCDNTSIDAQEFNKVKRNYPHALDSFVYHFINYCEENNQMLLSDFSLTYATDDYEGETIGGNYNILLSCYDILISFISSMQLENIDWLTDKKVVSEHLLFSLQRASISTDYEGLHEMFIEHLQYKMGEKIFELVKSNPNHSFHLPSQSQSDKPILFYDNDYFYIGISDFKEYISSDLLMNVTPHQLLHALDEEKLLKRYTSKSGSDNYAVKITTWNVYGAMKRLSVYRFERNILEKPGTLPLFKTEV